MHCNTRLRLLHLLYMQDIEGMRQKTIEGLHEKKGVHRSLADFNFLQNRANFWQTDLF